MSCIVFTPIYQERVWGGENFSSQLGRTLPSGKVIGESWEIVDRAEAQSVALGGAYQGMTLTEILAQDGKKILGDHYQSGSRFPLLIKWLDCQERLSLQVHPPAAKAEELQGEPKTEFWYVAHATPEAGLMVGLKKGATREQFETALQNNEAEPLVHREPSQQGSSIFVPSGRLHAIDGGNLILEIQQNSDTTYRVYDWGRMGLDGKPRALHIAESMASIDFDDFEPPLTPPAHGMETLAECAHFRIRKFDLEVNSEHLFLKAGQPRILHVVTGEVEVMDAAQNSYLLPMGTNAILSSIDDWTISPLQNSRVLLTDNFMGE